MKLNLNLTALISKIRSQLQPLVKRLPLLVFLLLLGLLISAVFTVNQILQQPSDQSYQSEQQKNSVRTRFDAQTIKQIERLKNRQESPNLDLPKGHRINPFNE